MLHLNNFFKVEKWRCHCSVVMFLVLKKSHCQNAASSMTAPSSLLWVPSAFSPDTPLTTYYLESLAIQSAAEDQHACISRRLFTYAAFQAPQARSIRLCLSKRLPGNSHAHSCLRNTALAGFPQPPPPPSTVYTWRLFLSLPTWCSSTFVDSVLVASELKSIPTRRPG